MTKLTAKNAELPKDLVKRLSVEVSVLAMARPVVCMCYYLDTLTYDYETGCESLVSSVKVGNERLFKKYSQLPIPFI